MPTVDDLEAEIKGIVQDKKGFDTLIPTWIIDASKYVSSRVLLPQLQDEATVFALDTGNTVALPSNFMRNLFYAESRPTLPADGKSYPIKVYSNLSMLLRRPWGIPAYDTGEVYAVTIAGDKLFYARRGNETLTIHYYRKPSETALESFFLDIAYDCLLNHVCWRIHARVEDGIDGQKINTGYYFEQLKLSIEELRSFLKQGVSLPPAPVVQGNFL